MALCRGKNDSNIALVWRVRNLENVRGLGADGGGGEEEECQKQDVMTGIMGCLQLGFMQ